MYRCAETAGCRVTCVRWNRANPDLLAVTYATLAIGDHPGLVCCWSPKNPDHPALIYRPPTGATCCDFSEHNAALLAVGCYDGSLALYSTSQKTPRPVSDCFRSTDKHMGAVWDVQFVMKDQGVGEAQREVLMTISEDGRVLQWTTRQGLQNVPVMTMRRDPSFSNKKETRTRKSEAFISRFAVGMHFSFNPTNSAQYLVATEAGSVHRCSTSHSDQYLFTYSGHMGPVYRVHWSPFVPHVLLTCSADWSFRVWHVDHKTAVLSVPSASKSAINDIQWSPVCATQLALCTDREVEVWDLAVSALDPLIVHPSVSRAAANTTLTFGDQGACLLIGDTNGGVTVYQMESLPEPEPDQAEKLEAVVETQLSRLLSTQQEEEETEEEAAAEAKAD
ncbi:dynein intermediate chain 4, axonemal-like [Pollicipes pollicipes]|uniref:dynein intermediate chain 4, axonemal-like n=1 Tax=Pollicipes pollicipes TaxID=41117 RepID=UPI00188570EC|nr:dynein intermediate chain 4, axonemal-like [Pollicipes pollicipes]